ncbi:MAG: twin-arginine translocase TatA/TatE family subunit [Chitinivibrionales bacterium]|nr:twin-arginine translocase TatA/TatE family subunit [Chitinivibrionales bacterium]
MGMFGPQELIIILIIVVLLFGAKKIPELAGGLGKGIKEFKKAQSEEDSAMIEENRESNEKQSDKKE